MQEARIRLHRYWGNHRWLQYPLDTGLEAIRSRTCEQFPTLEKVAIPSSGGVADIDMHDPVQVDWVCAFRMQPARDMIAVDALPGGTLDPTVDRSLPVDKQTGSVVGIDATFPFGAEIRTAGARPISRNICGPALAEKGHEYIEVADVPG
jgi:3-polyprenyl-4-hydroxybenzoate decarboxylase